MTNILDIEIRFQLLKQSIILSNSKNIYLQQILKLKNIKNVRNKNFHHD